MSWLRNLLCITFGCPPIVNSCFGEVTCGRCGGWIGDRLMGGCNLKDTAVIGHDCPDCWTAIRRSTFWDRRLLPDKARAFVRRVPPRENAQPSPVDDGALKVALAGSSGLKAQAHG